MSQCPLVVVSHFRTLVWVRLSPLKEGAPGRIPPPTPVIPGGPPAPTMNNQARAPSPARISTLVRASTPVRTLTSARTPKAVQILTPARTPTPVPTRAWTPTPVRAPASAWAPTAVQTPAGTLAPVPTLARTPTRIQTLTSARTPAPAQTRASARTPTPIQTPASAWTHTPIQTPARAPAPVPTLARTPTRIQTLTSARTPTPVQTPAWTPTPVQTQALAWTPNPSQTLARILNPVQMLTPARTPTPIPTPASARTPTPVQTLASAWTPTPIQTPTPVWTRTPVRTLTRIRTPTPARMLTRVQTPIPARMPTPIWTVPPAPAPTPVPSRVGIEITAAVPASESFPDSVLPLDPHPEPALEEPALSPDKDLSPKPSVKHFPSVASGFGSKQESILVHTPSATDFLGLTLGSTSRADSSAAKLTDSTPKFVLVPILGPDPLAPTLPESTNTFTPTIESFPMDSKIVIRVIYCYGLRFILLRKSLEQQFPNRLLFVSGPGEVAGQGSETPGAWRRVLTFSQPPTFPLQQEERAAQATGEFEVFVDGKLVHSKKVILSKGPRQGGRAVVLGSPRGRETHMSTLFLLCVQKGDGFVDEARLQKIMSIIEEEISKR
nr:selenoprotein V [Mirounga angustirostris]